MQSKETRKYLLKNLSSLVLFRSTDDLNSALKANCSTELEMEKTDRMQFVQMIKGLLATDPEERLSAYESLQCNFMTMNHFRTSPYGLQTTHCNLSLHGLQQATCHASLSGAGWSEMCSMRLQQNQQQSQHRFGIHRSISSTKMYSKLTTGNSTAARNVLDAPATCMSTSTQHIPKTNGTVPATVTNIAQKKAVLGESNQTTETAVYCFEEPFSTSSRHYPSSRESSQASASFLSSSSHDEYSPHETTTNTINISTVTALRQQHYSNFNNKHNNNINNNTNNASSSCIMAPAPSTSIF